MGDKTRMKELKELYYRRDKPKSVFFLKRRGPPLKVECANENSSSFLMYRNVTVLYPLCVLRKKVSPVLFGVLDLGVGCHMVAMWP